MLTGATVSIDNDVIRLHYNDRDDILIKPENLAGICREEAKAKINKEQFALAVKAESERLKKSFSDSTLPDDVKMKKISLIDTGEEQLKIKARIEGIQVKKESTELSKKRYASCMASIKAALATVESLTK